MVSSPDVRSPALLLKVARSVETPERHIHSSPTLLEQLPQSFTANDNTVSLESSSRLSLPVPSPLPSLPPSRRLYHSPDQQGKGTTSVIAVFFLLLADERSSGELVRPTDFDGRVLSDFETRHDSDDESSEPGDRIVTEQARISVRCCKRGGKGKRELALKEQA